MKPPCIRNLKRFEEGCPQKEWDGDGGCPAWIEMIVSKRNNPQEKVLEKMCVDLWNHKFIWASLGALEGVQAAVESHRNASCEPDPHDPFNDNKARPKPDLFTMKLVQILEAESKKRDAIIEYEIRKHLEGAKVEDIRQLEE